MKYLLLLALLTLTANARMGETLAECEARYGKGKRVGERVEFAKGDIAITVHFGKDEKCDYIFFTAYKVLSRRPFSDDERGGLLKANGLGHILVRRESIEGGEIEWQAGSKQVAAVMVGNSSRIVFFTPEGKKALDAHLEAESKKEPESIKGF
jgi:hypothetical protein